MFRNGLKRPEKPTAGINALNLLDYKIHVVFTAAPTFDNAIAASRAKMCKQLLTH